MFAKESRVIERKTVSAYLPKKNLDQVHEILSGHGCYFTNDSSSVIVDLDEIRVLNEDHEALCPDAPIDTAKLNEELKPLLETQSDNTISVLEENDISILELYC